MASWYLVIIWSIRHRIGVIARGMIGGFTNSIWTASAHQEQPSKPNSKTLTTFQQVHTMQEMAITNQWRVSFTHGTVRYWETPHNNKCNSSWPSAGMSLNWLISLGLRIKWSKRLLKKIYRNNKNLHDDDDNDFIKFYRYLYL